jgi:type IV pilus assembly protein PilE
MIPGRCSSGQASPLPVPGNGPKGFTVLELLIVVAIIAILLALAVPSFQQYLLRGHRAEAIHSVLAIAGCQERIRAATGYYDTTRCVEGIANDRYEFSLAPAGAARALEYTAMATPKHKSSSDHCGSLGIDQAGSRSIGGEPEHLTACWGGR